MGEVSWLHQDVLTWAEIFTDSEMDVKKMIVSQLISAVRVSMEYAIEVDFKISEKQLGLENEYEASTNKAPKQKKQRSVPEL